MKLTESYIPSDCSEPLLETTVGGVLRDAAARAPTRIALVSANTAEAEQRRWTYAELLAESERVAHALLALFEPGERIAVWAPNVAEWVLLEYGAALAGIVVVTVNPAYLPDELDYVLRQSRVSGLFYTEEFRGNPLGTTAREVASKLPELRQRVAIANWEEFLAMARPGTELPVVSPDDPVQIQYTSGTTGFPKGAILHHRGVTNNARLVAERWGAGPDDVSVSALPLFHTSGCVLSVLGAAQASMTLVLVYQFDPRFVLELIESERATTFGGVPTMLIAMMEHPDFATRDLSSLRVVSSGGATVPVELVRRIEETLGVSFAIVFGQTESSPVITQTRIDDTPSDKSETIGQPLPHTEVKIIDPATGKTQPVGETGELCTRGYLVMHGYFDMPEATADAIDADGWLHTGDLCAMDERGYCTIEGRLKDMIIRGGENIYPREIEESLLGHEAVAEIAVVGVPDPKWGEQVAAFVRFAPGRNADSGELFEFARNHLSAQKTPKFWIALDEFPLTGSGKIQKFVLRDRWTSGEYDAF